MADEQRNLNILDRLRTLFQGNIVIRKTDDDKLVVKDLNQSKTALASNFIDRYNKMMQNNSYGSSFSRMQNASYDVQRIELFKDYELMDNDPILSSALDIYSDESTVTNVEGKILKIKSENVKITEILHNLFYDVLNIEFNLWSWIRNLCKYGDFYLQMDILDKHGIVNIHPLSTYDVTRLEDHEPTEPNLVQFMVEGDKKNLLENYEVAHFRLLSDANYAPYGKSQIEGARKVFKQLTLMEDAMMIHRIMRAPERRVFKIDIGNIPPNEVENFMNKVINKIKKVPVIDQKTGDYNLRYNIHSVTEDFFLPVRGSDSGTTIDTVQGLGNEGQIEDIEYLRNKLMAALRIPKAFLGYEEGVGSKATLAAEDVRFARTIERIQKIVVSELEKIAIVHLFSQGFDSADLINFKLELENPSTIHEQEKLELMTQKIELANNAREAKLFSAQWIYDNIFDMSVDDVKSMYEGIIEDTKQKYRLEQIETEGNDPAQTGEAAGDSGEDDDVEMPRKGGTSYDQEKYWGRDRLGKDARKTGKGYNDFPNKDFKGGSPLATSKGSTLIAREGLLSQLRKKYSSKSTTSILNEKSLIKEEEKN